jgi:hypothetical protein
MSEKKGQHLSEWEWSVVLHANPEQVRKRFRVELEYLYNVGTLLDAIPYDSLLSHMLAYCWRDTYRLALVCKRFLKITRGREYWAALARHALKTTIPAPVLAEVNFFHGLAENDPPHMFLHVLFAKSKHFGVLYFGNKAVFHGLQLKVGSSAVYCLGVTWESKNIYFLENYYCSVFGGAVDGNIPTRRTYFNHQTRRKIVYFCSNGVRSTILRYVEIFLPAVGKTWHGEPNDALFKSLREDTDDQLFPGPNSMGIWK